MCQNTILIRLKARGLPRRRQLRACQRVLAVLDQAAAAPLNGWLSARTEAQLDVQTVLAALLERLITSREQRKRGPALKPVKG